MVTDKQIQQDRLNITLVAHPDTDKQRAIRTVPSNRPDMMRRAISQAVVVSHYSLADLAWLHPQDGSFSPILQLIEGNAS